MNQNDQMREALRLALAALKRVRHVDQQHSQTERAIEQALAAEPAPLLRLTDDEIVDAFVRASEKPYQNVQRLTYDSGPYEITKLTNTGRNIANAIMDAMERVNK